MRLLARNESSGIYDDALVASVGRMVDAGMEFCRTRLLEITVFGLLIFWWLEVFGVWVGVLQWAAGLGAPR